MLLASFDRDYLPDPPIPMSKACPPGYLRILPIRKRCCIAKLNKTRCIGLSVLELYEIRASSADFISLSLSTISQYDLE